MSFFDHRLSELEIVVESAFLDQTADIRKDIKGALRFKAFNSLDSFEFIVDIISSFSVFDEQVIELPCSRVGSRTLAQVA